MEDLKRLNWSAVSSAANGRPTVTANYYPTIQPTSTSSSINNSRPISNQCSGFGGPIPNNHVTCNTTISSDSFSNLVSFGSKKVTTLTLQEQQQKLEAEKVKQEVELNKQFDLQFGSGQLWDEVGTKGFLSTKTIPATPQNSILPIGLSQIPKSRSASPPAVNGSAIIGSGADKDLFAAFNSETIVDGSSHYPPPPDLRNPQAWESQVISTSAVFGENDDPFGLNDVKLGVSLSSLPTVTNDEDLLGDLGKPVEEIRRQKVSPTEFALVDQDLRNGRDKSWEKAVEDLMEMGFTAEKARNGLIESGSDLNIQAAVDYLLNDAHKQTYNEQPFGKKGKTKDSSLDARDISIKNSQRGDLSSQMRDERSMPRTPKNNYSSSKDLDISRTASVVGNNLVKTANSIWKVSQKKVQKVVSDYRQDSGSDTMQPKWMQGAIYRDPREDISTNEGRINDHQSQHVTDEALLLERCSSSLNQTKIRALEDKNIGPSLSHDTSHLMSKMTNKTSSFSYHQRQSQHQEKRHMEQPELEQVYTSPARRKNPTPQSTSRKCDQKCYPTKPSNLPKNTPITQSLPNSTIIRNKAPPRNIPSVSSADLHSSHQHRLTGTSHFKRGDYASAHDSYSSSLNILPVLHPINIVLLCNRALTSLKTGVPQSAVIDADKALKLIGVSRGDGETIDLGSGEGGGIKQMKVFYGKALLRKAEALEQMERWKDAGEVWRTCVEQGVGGSTASEGRTRCEKLLYTKRPSTDSRKVIPQKNVKSSSTVKNNSGFNTGESIAVKRLRESNEKAEIADNQRLLLIDKVDAMIGTWRDGKRDNLRALIGSLDGIMWKGSGWKSVGMHELVQNNKVKIHYMKAIGKTHPDKLPQDASIEVRMIAALVFATLNESWDKFKQQNQM